MAWKLILQLSMFGLAMGLATVFVIPPNIEPVCWLAIFLLCAYIIAKRCPTKRFLHGLFLGLANSVWITSAHILFYDHYIGGHAQEAAMMKSMPLPDAAKLMVAMVGLVIGLVSGTLIGLLALGAGKLIKRPLAPTIKTTA